MLPMGKMLPYEHRNGAGTVGTGPAGRRFMGQRKNGGIGMYIGLGGLLILILVLWLLGVI
jgi:hypothetical protein